MRYSQVRSALYTAKRIRLAELDRPGTQDNPLAGQCGKTALEVVSQLTQRGGQPLLACGSFTTKSSHPQNFTVAHRRGQHHFWVLIRCHCSESGYWHADCNPEVPPTHTSYAQPYLNSTPINDYTLHTAVSTHSHELTNSLLSKPTQFDEWRNAHPDAVYPKL